MPAPNKPADFWARVDTSAGVAGCWEWQGMKVKGGYGRASWRGSKILAHRIAWELTYGPIPDGLRVLHHCDNAPCCRPDHLFLGTQIDNIRDMVAKGRQSTGGWATGGEANPGAKLTWLEAAEIRSLYVPRRVSLSMLASKYGVTHDTIRRVVAGESYKVKA